MDFLLLCEVRLLVILDEPLNESAHRVRDENE
jgi:hypothetical protein